MKSSKLTAVVITVEHEELWLLKAALSSMIHSFEKEDRVDMYDQNGKVRELIEKLSI